MLFNLMKLRGVTGSRYSDTEETRRGRSHSFTSADGARVVSVNRLDLESDDGTTNHNVIYMYILI